MEHMTFGTKRELENYLSTLIEFLGNGRPEDYDLETIMDEVFYHDQKNQTYTLTVDTLEFLEVIESSMIDPSYDY